MVAVAVLDSRTESFSGSWKKNAIMPTLVIPRSRSFHVLSLHRPPFFVDLCHYRMFLIVRREEEKQAKCSSRFLPLSLSFFCFFHTSFRLPLLSGLLKSDSQNLRCPWYVHMCTLCTVCTVRRHQGVRWDDVMVCSSYSGIFGRQFEFAAS